MEQILTHNVQQLAQRQSRMFAHDYKTNVDIKFSSQEDCVSLPLQVRGAEAGVPRGSVWVGLPEVAP